MGVGCLAAIAQYMTMMLKTATLYVSLLRLPSFCLLVSRTRGLLLVSTVARDVAGSFQPTCSEVSTLSGLLRYASATLSWYNYRQCGQYNKGLLSSRAQSVSIKICLVHVLIAGCIDFLQYIKLSVTMFAVSAALLLRLRFHQSDKGAQRAVVPEPWTLPLGIVFFAFALVILGNATWEFFEIQQA